MDDLVGLAVIVILVVVAGAICGLIALVQLNALKQEVAVLRAKITHLQTHKSISQSEPQSEASTAQAAISITEPIAHKAQPSLTSQNASPPVINQLSAPPKKAKPAEASAIELLFNKLRAGFEENWMTWIGAIALAFGGIFLAKYSLEAGLLSPVMRLSLGGLFGLGLIAAAAYLHHKRIVFEGFNNYIPAALASGGAPRGFAGALQRCSCRHAHEPRKPRKRRRGIFCVSYYSN